jgi:predicted DNA-binding protein (UPF0251 family)
MSAGDARSAGGKGSELQQRSAAHQFGVSRKFATAKVERTTERAANDRSQGRERQAERGGDFNDQPPTY